MNALILDGANDEGELMQTIGVALQIYQISCRISAGALIFINKHAAKLR